MKVRVLGSNGWFTTQMGHTPCVLVDAAEYYVVFDAGEGMYRLDEYTTEDKPVYLFLSHFHLDHTYGFHLLPKFRFKEGMVIYGQPGTKDALSVLINHPFTMPLKDLKMRVEVSDLEEGVHAPPEVPFEVETAYLRHADPCFGYRLNIEGKTVTYCTDTGYCDNLVKLAKEADLFITESGLAPGTPINPEWPHLTPEIAAQAAKEAGVKKLLLNHFSPRAYPAQEDRQKAEEAAREVFPEVTAAQDGMGFEL